MNSMVGSNDRHPYRAHADGAHEASFPCPGPLGVTPDPRGDDHRIRRIRYNGQVFGLVGIDPRKGRPRREARGWSYRPSLPRQAPSAGDGCRSHSPLRDSPGFSPGSLSPDGANTTELRRHRTVQGLLDSASGEPAAPTNIANFDRIAKDGFLTSGVSIRQRPCIRPVPGTPTAGQFSRSVARQARDSEPIWIRPRVRGQHNPTKEERHRHGSGPDYHERATGSRSSSADLDSQALVNASKPGTGTSRNPARGNPVGIRDCPAAVSGNDRRHRALGTRPGSDGH